MPGEGQFLTPVQVEVTTDIGADVGLDGAPPPGAELRGLAVMGYYEVGNQLFVIRTNAAGELIVAATVTPITPGTTITSPADTAVGIGATVALPVPPAGTRRMTVQNTGPAGSLIRVREIGGAAGTGIILARFSSITYGGADGAIASLEVQDVAAIATSAAIQFEVT